MSHISMDFVWFIFKCACFSCKACIYRTPGVDIFKLLRHRVYVYSQEFLNSNQRDEASGKAWLICLVCWSLKPASCTVLLREHVLQSSCLGSWSPVPWCWAVRPWRGTLVMKLRPQDWTNVIVTEGLLSQKRYKNKHLSVLTFLSVTVHLRISRKKALAGAVPWLWDSQLPKWANSLFFFYMIPVLSILLGQHKNREIDSVCRGWGLCDL